MKKVFHTLAISLIFVTIFIISSKTVNSTGKEKIISEVSTYEYETEEPENHDLVLDIHESEPETEILSEEQQVNDEDIWLIAWITMGEAEGECEEGKRLVIDTILNRVDHSSFPNTIYDVIAQPMQYSSYNMVINNMGTDVIPQRCYDNALAVLNNDVDCPSDIVWQAGFIQGEIYEVYYTTYSTTYFCHR